MENRKTLRRNLKPSWVWAIALGSSIGWGHLYNRPTGWLLQIRSGQ